MQQEGENQVKKDENERNKTKSDKKKSQGKKEKQKNDTTESGKKNTKLKRMKKSIFISYSPDGSFDEKRFVVEFVQQIKENNMADDIWFDKDEGIIDQPFWLSSRLETIDKCRAVVMVISESFMSCPVTVYETKVILQRISSEENRPLVFCILLEQVEFSSNFAESLMSIEAELVDLTGDFLSASVEERSSCAVGNLCEKLDKIAIIKSPYLSKKHENSEMSWKGKRVIHWTSNDVIEWLYSLHVREFYRQSFAEKRIDGYLLLATTDADLTNSLGIDSKIVRKKISSELIRILKKEQEIEESWHLRFRSVLPHSDCVYLAYDPQDARLATNIKTYLTRTGLQVLSHEKLGQSKQEFLQLNGGLLAKCSHLLCMMTTAASASPFIFHEVIFFSWLGGKRSIVTLLFENTWNKLKTPIKAILGNQSAIDFEKRMYPEAMNILEHHISPRPMIPGVVFEQGKVERMKEGIDTLLSICASKMAIKNMTIDEKAAEPKVFLSYQWDVQDKVMQIVRFLHSHDIPCWSDVMLTPNFATSPRPSTRAVTSYNRERRISNNSIGGNMRGNMKSSKLLICCLTPKYVICQNCEQDLLLAQSMGKPVLLVMLQFITWPPDAAGERVKKMLVQNKRPIDMSTEKLFRANLALLHHQIVQYLS